MAFIAGSSIHRSLEARLAILPLAALSAVLTYQGTNAALYYLVAIVVEFWAYSEGEVRTRQVLSSCDEMKLTAIPDYLR